MNRFIFLFFCLLTSCVIRTGYRSSYTPAPIIYTTPYYPIRVSPNILWYNPRPNYLGNVYGNHHHHNHRPKIQTNLPLQNGSMGGRRK